LSIRAERRGERLLIDIENARVEGAAARRPGGVGLANVRARLAAHYGSDASLTALPTGARFVAHLDLPAVQAREAQS
jgi:LytS/YehU family sensor histidine kinase